jgi:hypothetical protein
MIPPGLRNGTGGGETDAAIGIMTAALHATATAATTSE